MPPVVIVIVALEDLSLRDAGFLHDFSRGFRQTEKSSSFGSIRQPIMILPDNTKVVRRARRGTWRATALSLFQILRDRGFCWTNLIVNGFTPYFFIRLQTRAY